MIMALRVSLLVYVALALLPKTLVPEELNIYNDPASRAVDSIVVILECTTKR
jgi:hypothetical protein